MGERKCGGFRCFWRARYWSSPLHLWPWTTIRRRMDSRAVGYTAATTAVGVVHTQDRINTMLLEPQPSRKVGMGLRYSNRHRRALPLGI